MDYIRRLIKWYRRPKSKTQDFFESLLLIVPIAFVIRTIGFGLYQVPTGSMETTMLVGERFFADKFTPLFGTIKHGDIISFNDPLFHYSEHKLVHWWQRYVYGPTNWTKRVIGVPGDHIRGVIEGGKPVVYRNGEKLDEPYINRYPLIATYDHARGMRAFSYKSYVPGLPYEQQPYYRLTREEVMFGRRYVRLAGIPDLLEPGKPCVTPTSRGTEREGKSFDIYDYRLGDDEYWAMGDNRLGSSDSRSWGVLKAEHIHGKIVFRLYSIDSDESWFIFDMIKHPIDFWRRVRWRRCLQLVR
jgi:signal peptidase I